MVPRTEFSLLLASIFLLAISCAQPKKSEDGKVRIGFIEAFEDPTLAKARLGFSDAMKEAGYSEKNGDFEFIQRNAQGDFPALSQAVDFLISKEVDLLASCATVTTVTAAQKTRSIPIFMMVAPEPRLAGLTRPNGEPQKNLFGVYETLDYIDTSFSLIKEVIPGIKTIGISYNPAETQSTDAYERMKELASKSGIRLESVAISNSSETLQAIESLMNRGIEAFFAMPDNTIFASFELIKKICDAKRVPIFTSEAGLVERGALCAYGADIYEWGKQSGTLAVSYLKGERDQKKLLQQVLIRKRIFHPVTAKKFPYINIPPEYEAAKP
jgi:putative ABC transport system substrate-binding protein